MAREASRELQIVDGPLIPDNEIDVLLVHRIRFDVDASQHLDASRKTRIRKRFGDSVEASGEDLKAARDNLDNRLYEALDGDVGPIDSSPQSLSPGEINPLYHPLPKIEWLKKTRIPLAEIEDQSLVEARFDVSASKSLNSYQKDQLVARNTDRRSGQLEHIVTASGESEESALKALGDRLSRDLKSFNPIWQALALWAPGIAALLTAGVLGLFDLPDLTTGDLRRIASLCASLLIAGLAGTGIVAALGLRTEARSVNQTLPDDPTPSNAPTAAKRVHRVSKVMRRSQAGAGLGVLISLVLTCAGIVAGGLATESPVAEFLCISGLIAAVLQIFAGPTSLALARLGHRPFLLDELAI